MSQLSNVGGKKFVYIKLASGANVSILSVLFITLYKIINIFLSKVTHVDLLMIVALSYLLANANWMLKCKKKKKIT